SRRPPYIGVRGRKGNRQTGGPARDSWAPSYAPRRPGRRAPRPSVGDNAPPSDRFVAWSRNRLSAALVSPPKETPAMWHRLPEHQQRGAQPPRRKGEAPADAVAGREAQDHEQADVLTSPDGEPARGIDYPADP